MSAKRNTHLLCMLLMYTVNISMTHAQMPVLVKHFSLDNVRLTDSPFKKAQDLNIQYLLTLEPDKLLAPFLREAGLNPKAESYTNWENTGLDGHIGGHYLSALSLMYASTGDIRIKERLDYMLAELQCAQTANGNGYVGGVPGGKAIWDQVASGNIKAGSFDLNDKWVPLYNIHKTYAGLRDAYLYTGDKRARDMLIQMTDWAVRLVSRLSENQIQDMLRSEHGGLNETFADVAAITGDEKYLTLAHQFSQHAILNPLLNAEDKLTGMHANTQIPKVLGYKRIADLENNKDWSEAARFFWETVIDNRSVSIGGNSAYEHFNPTDDFSRMITGIEGPETCNTYNMLRLSKMLYHTSLDKKYMDYYEKALYNHILSTQHPENGGLVYFTQMRPGHYRVYSQPHTSMWCCVGSGIENHGKYGEMIYAHSLDALYVNLFISSELSWKEKNTEIVQQTAFPSEATTRLLINPAKKANFILKIRRPDWAESKTISIRLNGKKQKVTIDEHGYLSLRRTWKKGDQVEVEMPMSLRTEQLPDQSNYYSFVYGPIVLAAKTGQEDLAGLYADDSRGGHIARGTQIPMKDMPILVSDPIDLLKHIEPVVGKPLTFRLSGLFPNNYEQSMELIPFFQLHDSRYIIYWPQSTPEQVVEMQRQIEIEEDKRLKLDAVTVDRVISGQQQPESDHFIQSDRSSTGYLEGVHWREAKGWFSYELKNNTKEAKYLYLEYFDRDRDRSFDVYLNKTQAQTIELKGNQGDQIVKTLIPIPSNEKTKEKIRVKFVAREGKTTAKITEVRLVK